VSRKSILVTGGAGFIGSHLVERLLARGERVVVIDDLSTGRLNNLRAVRKHPRLKVVVAKISACPGLPQLARRSRAIAHLAAAVGVELVVRQPVRTLETNLHETEILLKAAAAARTPVLLASTSEVYGKSRKASFRETDDLLIGVPTRSRWGYACSKLMDEFLALAYAQERKLPVIIARLFNTVGPRQTGRHGMVLPRFIAAAKKNRPLKVHGDGTQTRCFCFVEDTVEALVRLLDCPAARGGIFNVGGTQEISIRTLAEEVIAVTGSRSRIQFVPYSRAYAPGFEDMLRRKPVVAKLARTIGFRPATPLRTTIERTARAAA
jgi:UDP-glucose 4-epimerase